ncbi:class I SAM-dependent methyltransferase, partial [Pelagibacteraceae bacterium]|nr:class I SAM-dependent methyltransferase [Pelagibacteraceae bacterium]
MISTGKLYGKYAHRFGTIFNQKNINTRKNTLKKLPLFKKGRLKVLELGGTGQDAVAWAQLGFDVTYIDLSKENISKTKNFILNKNLNLKCINKDFLNHNFKEKFDIIRSRGVIHHISQPEKVFIKINKLLKDEGYFHFNLYRSGTFYYWFVENLRKFSKKINFKKFYDNLLRIKLSVPENNKIGNHTIKSVSKFYNIIIDDLYVPTLLPANYFEVRKFLTKNNFKIIKENKIRKRLDHNLLYPDFPLKKEHVVFDCKKLLKKKILKTNIYFNRQNEIDLTKKDLIINSNNKLFEKLYRLMIKKRLNRNKDFIKKIIVLYKNSYLLSVKKGNKTTRHKKLN